jgi:hypothetical protein
MIAFGCAILDTDSYRSYAEPGIRRAAEADSVHYALAPTGGVGRSYNLLLEQAAPRDDLEALVLVHPHAEITDPAFCGKARAALQDPDVAIVGAVGAAVSSTKLLWAAGPVLPAASVARTEKV